VCSTYPFVRQCNSEAVGLVRIVSKASPPINVRLAGAQAVCEQEGGYLPDLPKATFPQSTASFFAKY